MVQPPAGWRSAPYLRTAETLAVLDCATRELDRLVDTGVLPCHTGPDGHRRWLPRDVARVLRARRTEQRGAPAVQATLWGPGSRGGRP